MHLKFSVLLLLAVVVCAAVCSTDGSVLYGEIDKRGSPVQPIPPSDGANLREWQQYLIALRAYRRYIDTLRYGRSVRAQPTPIDEFLEQDSEEKGDREYKMGGASENAVAQVHPENDKKLWMSVLIKSLLHLL
ncbi:uncharacterized protein [Ptychodera flava]|uniref:uncharacterized protein n=1 Tax=Ptychodera flava TaxID=63121 RepID=UPI00396A27F8